MKGKRGTLLPMKGACEDEVVVRGQFLEPGLELSVVDETTSLVDDDERKDRPILFESLVSSGKKLDGEAS